MQEISSFSIQPLQLILNGRTHWLAYLIHNSDGPDQVLLNHDGRLVISHDVPGLETALRMLGVPVDDQFLSVFVDGPKVTSCVSLDDLTPMPRDPLDPATANRLWDGWSMLDDLCLTIGRPLGFHGQIANSVLDKLFWGMNLKAITPPGEAFTPTMSPKERAKWAQIIGTGLRRVESAICNGRSAGQLDRP